MKKHHDVMVIDAVTEDKVVTAVKNVVERAKDKMMENSLDKADPVELKKTATTSTKKPNKQATASSKGKKKGKAATSGK